MNIHIMRSMLSAVLLLLIMSGAAAAEVVKGTVKAIAGEANMFTLKVSQERVLLLSWNKQTQWRGLSSSSALKVDEILSVDFILKGDNAVAASVARVKTLVPAGMKAMTLDRLLEDFNGREGASSLVLVDTRPKEMYVAGYIPGAISAPLSRLVKRTDGLLPEARTAKLVFYDEGQGGETAGKAAELAAKAGYTDLAVFMDGSAGWVDSGRFLASATFFIRKSKPIVIDVRNREQVAQGHIEGAVNYPLALFKEYYGHFPLNRSAPIVIYGDTDKDALSAAETIRSWGYRNVTVYPGGAAVWVKNAEVLESGPAGELIMSPAASHGGKLKAEDFEKALLSLAMVEIIDVRTAAEHKKGGFPESRRIPLQELPLRHGELDKGKIQVVFAADATRAEMAYEFLKSKQYRVNYLNGYVEFGKDGAYKVK